MALRPQILKNSFGFTTLMVTLYIAWFPFIYWLIKQKLHAIHIKMTHLANHSVIIYTDFTSLLDPTITANLEI